MPNLPKDDVPAGEDEADNVEYYGPNGNAATAAKARPPKPSFSFKPKEHYETGEALGMMDFETAAKISGARFTMLKSQPRAYGTRPRPVHARPAHDTSTATWKCSRRCWCSDDALYRHQLSCRSSRRTFVLQLPHGESSPGAT